MGKKKLITKAQVAAHKKTLVELIKCFEAGGEVSNVDDLCKIEALSLAIIKQLERSRRDFS